LDFLFDLFSIFNKIKSTYASPSSTVKKEREKKKTIEVSYIGHTCIDIGSIVHVQTMPRTQGHLPAMERGKKKKSSIALMCPCKASCHQMLMA
jgi:hypothetical protein